jgi:hypothetical protein
LATNNNKPDLSDLKARLGLKNKAPAGGAASSGPAQGGGPGGPRPGMSQSSSGQHAVPGASQSGPQPVMQAGPAPQAPQSGQGYGAPPQAASGPVPVMAAPRPAAPPMAAAGPPRAKARSQERPRRAEPDPLERIHDAIELPDDVKIPGGSVFSGPVLTILGAMLVLGLLFGWLFATSSHHRQIDNARTADAMKIRDGLVPMIADFKEAASTINSLDPATVNFEAAETLGSRNFAASGQILNGNRLLLGGEIIDSLTSYITDSAMLSAQLAEHNRLTNVVDKEEITQLLADNEALEGSSFAALFDFRHALSQGGDANYRPRLGRLVTLTEVNPDEEGKVEVTYLNSTRTEQVDIRGLIPIQRGIILAMAGDNVLQRYERRVRNIKALSDKIGAYTPRMQELLDELADRSSAPILKLSS